MATDSLNAFTDWPDDLIASNSAANPAPAADKIVAWHPPENSETSPLVHVVHQAAFQVNWQFIHTEEGVGRHFINNYAYFELIGPTGHFRSDQCCAFIGYWGPSLFYRAHHHASEEFYFWLTGHALFDSDGNAPATLGSAEHRSNASHQPHNMTTTDNAILTLVLRRGPDLTGLTQLGGVDHWAGRPNRYGTEYGQSKRRLLFPLWHHRQDRVYAVPDWL